ncbi:LacI family DNA-binding transcriptional regulator [Thetidibacter halocola]|uniref:LacI family DNA-binding transcriptional regulator n=1 Tax=Thetidibacter halocola TaxID=2827239 RepID=A0A8J7WJL7_9RHOB|nr:LacI family DNA-binding transcriptional regulator [Thetidibacter halocola]MBS0126446.1 LacI family DNA-binding transcriptional regulator [Thetidibacter halocola]
MSKPTYAQIAQVAGVGTATVERVLNGRGGVRPALVEQVVRAARALDWPGRLPDRHRGIVRVEVILVRPETSFFSRLASAFRRIAATLDPTIQLHVTFLDESRPEAIAARIDAPGARRSGLVIASPDAPAIRDALLRLRQTGAPLVQIVTPTLPNADFVGIDNLAAGRTAALMLARLGAVRGPVLALCHSPVYRVHRDRLRGFSDRLAAEPGAHLVHVGFTRDSRTEAARRVTEALALWPDLAGVYNAGGGNAGVTETLRRARRPVFFVGHELTETMAEALTDGTAGVILDQRPEAQARRATDLMLVRLGLIAEPMDNPPIRFTTLTAESL